MWLQQTLDLKRCNLSILISLVGLHDASEATHTSHILHVFLDLTKLHNSVATFQVYFNASRYWWFLVF